MHKISIPHRYPAKTQTLAATFLLKHINWLATTLSIVGILFNANKNIWCWPLWIGGCICWLIYLIPKKEWAQTILWFVFLLFNGYGWYQWLQ